MGKVDMKKEVYERPVMISNGSIEGVIPAGLPGAIAAFTAGVAAGVAVKKMLNGRIAFNRVDRLVEVGVSI